MTQTNAGDAPRVSIIIVSYNTRAMLKDCIESILARTAGVSYEIIVVDNNSEDGSPEMVRNEFPGALLIANKANIGFGAANNRARAAARGEYVFFLNSDTVLLNNAVKMFYDFWESSNAPALGALGCNLRDAEGNITASHGKFFYFKGDLKMYAIEFLHLVRTAVKGGGSFRKPVYEKYIGEVDIIVGAALFMKNNADAAFDERFFLYHEEADLQFRLANLGKKRLLIDGPEITHLSGMSDKQTGGKYARFCSAPRMYDYISRLKYHRKHHTHPFCLAALKIAVLMLAAFPPLLPYTKKYIKELLSV